LAQSVTLLEHFLNEQALEMVDNSQETTHFGFQTVAKEQQKAAWWPTFFILWPLNMTL
jgi:hypothetical protein